MIRNPVVAGQFYPQTKQALEKMLSKFISKPEEKQDVKGVIMPHAGYIYSGYVAGSTISKIEVKRTVVILGVNHTGAGKPFSLMNKGSWLTPMGEVKIDTEIAEAILKESCLIKDDPGAHLNEHSIEVQLPLLQYIRKDLKIVPISVSEGSIDQYRDIADSISSGFKKVGRSALFLASTDFTHYETKETVEEKDSKAINAILDLDEEKLLGATRDFNISMCGAAPTSILLKTCKNIGASRAGLVKYQTSGDVSGDYSSVVGYAGMVIW